MHNVVGSNAQGWKVGQAEEKQVALRQVTLEGVWLWHEVSSWPSATGHVEMERTRRGLDTEGPSGIHKSLDGGGFLSCTN